MGQRLKEARLEKCITQDMLANIVGFNKSTIQRYESGKINKVKLPVIEAIASYLEVNPAWIVGKSSNKYLTYKDNKLPHPDLMPIKTKKWRVLGDIACGEPIYADEDFDSYIEAGADIPADFCVRAKGDSMINARIQDGDIVFIRKQPLVENGDIAAVVIEDGITLKRFYKHGDTVHLLAENPKYEPLIYSNEELEQIYIIGKAVAFQSDIK